MEYVILTIGIILSIAGIIGCFVPAIPGPPLNYIALTILKLYDGASFSVTFLVIAALVTIAATALDYFCRFGAGKFTAFQNTEFGDRLLEWLSDFSFSRRSE